jgi:KDO2-lipid IV(A) lauroyltransferase
LVAECEVQGFVTQDHSSSTYVWLYRLAAVCSRHLPRRFSYWLGLRIADLYYWRRVTARQAVMNNLRRIFAARGVTPAAAALPGFARKTFQHFGKYLVDFFRFAQLTEGELRKFVNLENVEALREAAARGKGVLVVTAHLGNWEVGGAVIAALGYRLNAVALPQSSQKLDRLFNEQRASRGIHVLPLGHAAFGIVRCLKRGEIVALLGDRNFTHQSERYDFFGAPAPLPRGPAWLAAQTGAPLVPSFLLRQEDDTFLLRCHPPIYPEVAGSEDAIRAAWIATLEKEIAAAPWQWFIFDDFWT